MKKNNLQYNRDKTFEHPRIRITGNCLLLIGPIGCFFSRLANHLEYLNFKAYKIIFPLKEFGFKKDQIINFDSDINIFKNFIEKVIKDLKIKHIFMYGDYIIPHKVALNVIENLNQSGYNIKSHIFELGYFRPNFVTIEEKEVNSRSETVKILKDLERNKLIKEITYKQKQSGIRWRKVWKSITFIQHAFTKYKIIDYEHKLQPKPIYLYYQIKGFLRKYKYLITEINIKRYLMNNNNLYFLAILQVNTDTQIIEDTKIKDMYHFIDLVISSFRKYSKESDILVFKHHPRDRGYINYYSAIEKKVKEQKIENRVKYFHDIKLGRLYKEKNCQGTITVNSTVGIQSLFHNIPVKVLGNAFYDIDDLCYQGDLDKFWKDKKFVNQIKYKNFENALKQKTEINGNFDGYFPFKNVFYK